MVGPDHWVVSCNECGESGHYADMRPDRPTMHAWQDVKHKDGCTSASVPYEQARQDKLFKLSVALS